MVLSEKSHQPYSNQFLFKNWFEFNKKVIISSEKWEIQMIQIQMIMLTRSSERILNPSRYTGLWKMTMHPEARPSPRHYYEFFFGQEQLGEKEQQLASSEQTLSQLRQEVEELKNKVQPTN